MKEPEKRPMHNNVVAKKVKLRRLLPLNSEPEEDKSTNNENTEKGNKVKL